MKILIIEDEPHNAQLLSEIIMQLKPNLTSIDILESIEQSLLYLSSQINTPDLIFADIQEKFQVFCLEHLKKRTRKKPIDIDTFSL